MPTRSEVTWPDSDDHDAWARLADRAMQFAMLEVDREHAKEWLVIMRELVASNLPRDEFTEQRMVALKAWERRRKLAQTNLRYQFHLDRRRPALVRRDVRQFLASRV